MSSRQPRGAAHRVNAETRTAVRHATAQGPLYRLAVQYDALRAAYRAAVRTAENRADPAPAEQVERVVDDAAAALAAATARALRLRERDVA